MYIHTMAYTFRLLLLLLPSFFFLLLSIVFLPRLFLLQVTTASYTSCMCGMHN